MTRAIDLAYLAGIVDGEGYIGIKKSPPGKRRKTPGYHARIQVRMTDEAAIAFLAATLGGNYYKERPNTKGGKPLYCWQASNAKAEMILRALMPHLRVKRRCAENVLACRQLQSTSQGHRTKWLGERVFPNAVGTVRRVANLGLSDEYVARCEAFYRMAKALNAVGV